VSWIHREGVTDLGHGVYEVQNPRRGVLKVYPHFFQSAVYVGDKPPYDPDNHDESLKASEEAALAVFDRADDAVGWALQLD
jgi:hypothetical protein